MASIPPPSSVSTIASFFFCFLIWNVACNEHQVDWAEEVMVAMSNLTGPAAPHYFRITCRKYLALKSDGIQEKHVKSDDRSYTPNGDDVMMVVKDLMASVEVSQIILMVPAADLPRIHALPRQPSGIHARRHLSDSDRKKLRDIAKQVRRDGAISQKACDYLVDWAEGTRRRLPRPARYNFLNHSVSNTFRRPVQIQPALVMAPKRPVRVVALGDRACYLPVNAESEDEAGDRELQL